MRLQDPGDLSGLHDIVMPPPISVWPLAWGWYLLATVVALGAAFVVWRLLRSWHRNAYRRAALNQLALMEREVDVMNLPALLRRTALCAYPRETVVSLDGDAWLEFLDETASLSLFTVGSGRAMGRLAYDPKVATAIVDPSPLFQAARLWIREHRASC